MLFEKLNHIRKKYHCWLTSQYEMFYLVGMYYDYLVGMVIWDNFVAFLCTSGPHKT